MEVKKYELYWDNLWKDFSKNQPMRDSALDLL